MGTIEVEETIEGRAPAKAYLDGFDSPAFYRPGRAVTGRPYVMIHQGDRTRASVGSFSSVGPDVVLMVGGNHRIDWVTTFAVRELYDLDGAYEGNPGSRGDIDIGADVTIGRGAVVLSGVTVGPGAVISPFAVVTRDVRPFAVVAGCPAREVGRRFDDDQVERLLRLAWWEWPGARIRSALGVPESIAQALLEDEKRAKTWRLTVELNKARLKAAWALEGVASRIAPPRSPPSPPDFPLRIWSYPETVLAMGWGVGGGCPPVVHHDDSGRWRATVGNYCSLAYDAELVLDGGPLPTPLSAVALGLDPDAGRRSAVGDITIGSDVWLTRGAKVLSGVTIGHGAVIAAYAVVTEDVRPFAVVAGNPGREVSRRFDDDTVEALLRIAWWEWPEDVVRERAPDLASPDVAAFVERYRAHV